MQKQFINLYLARKLAKKCGNIGGEIKRSDAANIICYLRFEGQAIENVLKELEKDGFITIVDQKNIRINRKQIEDLKEWF